MNTKCNYLRIYVSDKILMKGFRNMEYFTEIKPNNKVEITNIHWIKMFQKKIEGN